MTIVKMKTIYDAAKRAKTDSMIQCPYCGNKHEKTTYHKVFCSNAKTKKRNNCKDNFWNKVDPEKRCRKTAYFFNVIEPARHEREEYNQLDDGDSSWDVHRCHVERCEFCGKLDCECNHYA